MLDTITKVFTKLVGSKSDKDIKVIMPIVEKIESFEARFAACSNDELRGKTEEFKARIQESIKDKNGEIEALRQEVGVIAIDLASKIVGEKRQEDKVANKVVDDFLKEIETGSKG